MATKGQQPEPVIETLAGFFAGVASTLAAHPLDVLKTRLQAASKRPSEPTRLVVISHTTTSSLLLGLLVCSSATPILPLLSVA
ncbi:MAG: hypothetical protein L6R35_005724 [Caloplaca aegaea]|nr:MAG: hypothetical protein L6R35_005724 [Caloplaca aegaea]